MTTTTYPDFTLTTIDKLEPGEWAFAREQPSGESYRLVMMTNKQCQDQDEDSRWLLTIIDGSAGFYWSTRFQSQVARIRGDVRIPLPIHQQRPETGHVYKPGFLYSSISEEGLYLIAQLRRNYGAASVGIDGAGMMPEIPDRADLWRAESISYRAPGDSEWMELARIDAALEP